MKSLRLVLTLGLCLLPLHARLNAQGRTTLSPSLSFGVAHDDNVFVAPRAQAVTDWAERLTPGFGIGYETQTVNFFGKYDFDVERYRRNSALDSNIARQGASTMMRIVASPMTTVTVRGAYDRTNSPVQFNVLTGLVTSRFNAWRWMVSPEIARKVAQHTMTTVRYDLSADYVSPVSSTTTVTLRRPGSRLLTHMFDAKLGHEVSPRQAVYVRGLVRDFEFSDARAIRSIAGLFGWKHRLAPFTTMTMEGGPRIASGGRWRPEIDVALERRRGMTDASISYSSTHASAVGLSDVVDVQRVLARMALHRRNVIDASLQGGYFINDLSGSRTYVYTVGTDVTRRLIGPLSLAVGYSVAFQRGHIGALQTAAAAVPLVPSSSTIDVLPALIPQESLRRSVLLFRVLFSPQLRPGPRPPEAERDPRRPKST